jgi:hypothetical protein
MSQKNEEYMEGRANRHNFERNHPRTIPTKFESNFNCSYMTMSNGSLTYICFGGFGYFCEFFFS